MTRARRIVCLKTPIHVFSCSHFLRLFGAFFEKAKVSEGTNRNTLVQLLALYTKSESDDGQCHRQTDGRHDDDGKSRSYCVAV